MKRTLKRFDMKCKTSYDNCGGDKIKREKFTFNPQEKIIRTES